MELQEVISLRRSIKKFKHDMVINDEDVFKAIEQATDAPNHGMREPWRVIHVAFPNSPEKQEDHYNAVTNLGGMLVLVLKTDPRQRQNRENFFAMGAYTQNLMLLLYEKGIGTCWKTPLYIFEPKVRKAFGIAKDEAIAGLLYLTDLEEVPPKAKRKNKHLISEY